MIPVKDDIPTDRAPLITWALLVACVVAGFVFGGGLVPWVAAIVLLWFAGPAIEDAMGRGVFVAYALGAGVLGCAVQLAVDRDVSMALAAAGAVVTAAAAAHVLIYPWARVYGVTVLPFFFTILAVPLLAIVVVWIVVQVLIGALGWGDVPVGAQVTGAVFGVGCARLLARHAKTPGDLLQRGRTPAT